MPYPASYLERLVEDCHREARAVDCMLDLVKQVLDGDNPEAERALYLIAINGQDDTPAWRIAFYVTELLERQELMASSQDK